MPIKLLINIKMNKVYIKGKYICPFLVFIWFTTILCIVAYMDSWLMDHLLLIILLLLVAKTFRDNIKKIPIVRYKPMLVKDICILAKIGASILSKFLISNWSKGLVVSVRKWLCINAVIYYFLFKYVL